MTDADYTLTLWRLEEILAQARELASNAKADMLVYLIEMARLELQVMQSGEDTLSADDLLKILRGKSRTRE